MAFKVPNEYRVKVGPFGSTDDIGNNGYFRVPVIGTDKVLQVIASDGEGWEHVSVSLKNRNPTWDEMNLIKDKFWGEEDTVIQFHPKKSEYVNNHQFCLHLWRKPDLAQATPPSELVGIKNG